MNVFQYKPGKDLYTVYESNNPKLQFTDLMKFTDLGKPLEYTFIWFVT